MPIWGDEIRERAEREYRLKLEAHSGADMRRLAEERRLNRKIEPPPSPPTPGVYEEEIHPPGEHWYKIVLPSGAIGIVHFPDELCDAALLPNLWKRYWAHARRKLKII